MLRRIRNAQLQMDNARRTLGRAITIMEVCGVHTVSIFRNAIRASLPAGLRIVSGPGCAICSADENFINVVHNLAYRDDCIMAGRAELLTVPHRQTGRSIAELEHTTAVCCILDALEMAKINPDKTVIYAAVGFETCVPGAAVAVELAKKENIKNFCILSGLKSIAPGIKKIAENINTSVDGFLCCGNLAAITGTGIYDQIMTDCKKPCLSIGFEPMQLIEGIGELCRQIAENTYEHKLQFAAAATYDGNKIAKKYIEDYFDITGGNWTGLGFVENSAFVLKDEFAAFDAVKRFEIPANKPHQPTLCLCGDVLCGLIDPPQCSLFGKECTRKTPLGACMATSEGACSVWEKYSRRKSKN